MVLPDPIHVFTKPSVFTQRPYPLMKEIEKKENVGMILSIVIVKME